MHAHRATFIAKHLTKQIGNSLGKKAVAAGNNVQNIPKVTSQMVINADRAWLQKLFRLTNPKRRAPMSAFESQLPEGTASLAQEIRHQRIEAIQETILAHSPDKPFYIDDVPIVLSEGCSSNLIGIAVRLLLSSGRVQKTGAFRKSEAPKARGRTIFEMVVVSQTL